MSDRRKFWPWAFGVIAGVVAVEALPAVWWVVRHLIRWVTT